MPGLALLLALIAAVLLSVPASAQGPADQSVQFTLGRVVHVTPDSRDRIGIRSACAEAAGCRVDYRLTRGSRLLGGNRALFLGNTVQTDYVTLTKRMAASLRRRRMLVTITADVRNPDGSTTTLTKSVTLGPKKKKSR